jgi:histidyl-tRNA synthetase
VNSALNLPLAGMADLYGLPLRKRRLVLQTLHRVASLHGYEQVEIPLVERASSFSEDIVGRSPWPEWDKRGCFYLRVPDYGASYEVKPREVEALLVPEGTISVTRWLGHMLAENPRFVFPLKLYYELPCFRNELIDSLSDGKRRQFTQFGIEILGASSERADTEVIYLITACLRELGVESASTLVRIGDVAVFNRLVALSGIGESQEIALKEALDATAECKAGKGTDRLPALQRQVSEVLAVLALPEQLYATWLALVDPDETDNLSVVAELNDPPINERLRRLENLQTSLESVNVRVKSDLCVVRSHEYYSGIAFEVDISQDGYLAVEVAGGGRYDKLVGHFVQAADGTGAVPSTGFAFGVERLISLLECLGPLAPCSVRDPNIPLTESTADVLIAPPVGGKYFAEANSLADSYRSEGQRADVYVGDIGALNEYAAARRIESIFPMR